MKRSALIVAAVLLVPASAAAADPVFSGHEIRVTSNLADQFDPAISGNLVVYTDRRGIDADVYYTDLLTMQEVQVTAARGNQELTDVSHGNIAFTDSATGDVFVFDVASGSSVNLTDDVIARAREPGIGQQLVAWEDSRDGNWEIYARDLVSGEQRRITTDAGMDAQPSVSGARIAYQRCGGLTCSIYVYEWASASTFQITDPAYVSREPDIFGTKVVYESTHGGSDVDLFAFDLADGSEVRLARAGNQLNANVSGDLVAFEELGTDGRYHIRLWHVASGSVFAIETGSASGQYLNDLDANRVVYTDDRNGQLDIYMYEFELSFPPPSGARNCADLAGATPLFEKVLDRTKGAPNDYAFAFAADIGEGLICIDNGFGAKPFLTAGTLSLNGAVVVPAEGFVDASGAPLALVEARAELRLANSLAARLVSKPGAAIRVRVFSAAASGKTVASGVGTSRLTALANGLPEHQLQRIGALPQASDLGQQTQALGTESDPAVGCSQGGAGLLAPLAVLMLVAFALLPRRALARKRIRR